MSIQYYFLKHGLTPIPLPLHPLYAAYKKGLYNKCWGLKK